MAKTTPVETTAVELNASEILTAPVEGQPPFELDREKHIVISNKVYERDALPDSIRGIVASVNFSDQEIANREQNLQVYKYGRDRMVNDLITAIEESDVKPLAEAAPKEEAAE